MVRFRLRSQFDGSLREFSLMDILKTMGETVNDEIRFTDGNREEVFNLSSFEDISMNSGQSTQRRIQTEAIVVADGQKVFSLALIPQSFCILSLNGLQLRQGIDYTKNGKQIELLYPLIVSSTHRDQLDALYDVG